MQTSRYIVEFLRQNGVEVVFGVGGANIEDIYDAIYHYGKGMQVIIAKHEFSAITMADGYSRISRKIGVAISTSGGGTFNLVPGIAEAFTSSVPLLVIAGQIPETLEGKGGFQDSSGKMGTISAESVFRPISKYCKRITHADQIPQALHNAIHTATLPPCGPSVLLIPKNVQTDMCGSEGVISRISTSQQNSIIDRDEYQLRLKKSAHLINENPNRVCIICGESANRENIRELIKDLASKLNAKVAVTAGGKGAFDNHSQYFSGVVGIMGHPAAQEAITRSDVCIFIGTNLSLIDRYGLGKALERKKIIYINSEPSYIQSLPHIALPGSIFNSINGIIARLKIQEARPFTPLDGAEKENLMYPRTRFIDQRNENSIEFKDCMKILERHVETTANIVVDAGNTGAAAIHYLNAPSNGTFTIALGMGGMGYSFGAAIGVCLANWEKTYVIAGDGAFFMHGHEIHTAVELMLPIVFIIINNNSHAMCVTREAIYFRASYSYNSFKRTRIGDGVQAMFPSMTVLTVESICELTDAMGGLADLNTPAMICVEMDGSEIPPFRPFLDELNIFS
jgi:acetolactate synthase I/II/III large subunit